MSAPAYGDLLRRVHVVRLLAQRIDGDEIAAAIAAIDRAEAAGPILDPTLFIKSAGFMEQDRETLIAVRALGRLGHSLVGVESAPEPGSRAAGWRFATCNARSLACQALARSAAMSTPTTDSLVRARVRAGDIEVGDRVARSRGQVFLEVTRVEEHVVTVRLHFSDGSMDWPRLDAAWWREITPVAFAGAAAGERSRPPASETPR